MFLSHDCFQLFGFCNRWLHDSIWTAGHWIILNLLEHSSLLRLSWYFLRITYWFWVWGSRFLDCFLQFFVCIRWLICWVWLAVHLKVLNFLEHFSFHPLRMCSRSLNDWSCLASCQLTCSYLKFHAFFFGKHWLHCSFSQAGQLISQPTETTKQLYSHTQPSSLTFRLNREFFFSSPHSLGCNDSIGSLSCQFQPPFLKFENLKALTSLDLLLLHCISLHFIQTPF